MFIYDVASPDLAEFFWRKERKSWSSEGFWIREWRRSSRNWRGTLDQRSGALVTSAGAEEDLRTCQTNQHNITKLKLFLLNKDTELKCCLFNCMRKNTKESELKRVGNLCNPKVAGWQDQSFSIFEWIVIGQNYVFISFQSLLFTSVSSLDVNMRSESYQY